MKWYFQLLGLFFLLPLDVSVANSEPSIKIYVDATLTATVTRSELLKNSDVTKVIVNPPESIYGGKTATFTAIPLCKLLQSYKIQPEYTVQVACKDGFFSYFPGALVANCTRTQSIGLLAIEKSGEKWPDIPTQPRIGKAVFSVIWKNPKLSNISVEAWAREVESITILRKNYQEVFKGIPQGNHAKTQSGFFIYAKNCINCHTINLIGNSKIGPDLNYPYNPVEYFKRDFLKKFIRNPRSVRYMEHEKMSGFPESALSNKELDDLIQYFEYLKDHKLKI